MADRAAFCLQRKPFKVIILGPLLEKLFVKGQAKEITLEKKKMYLTKPKQIAPVAGFVGRWPIGGPAIYSQTQALGTPCQYRQDGKGCFLE